MTIALQLGNVTRRRRGTAVEADDLDEGHCVIKLAIAAPANEIHDFIAKRLSGNLVLTKLRSRPLHGQAIARFFVSGEPLDDGILLVHRTPDSTDVVVITTPETVPKGVFVYALVLRAAEAGNSELYLDTLQRALQTGLVRVSKRTRLTRNIVVGGLLIAVLFAGAIIALPVIIFFIIFMPIIYPVSYWLAKRRFKREQAALNTLSTIFEHQFAVASKANTKDWMTFWHRVKRQVELEVLP